METKLMKTIMGNTLLITIGFIFDLLLLTLLGLLFSIFAGLIYIYWLSSLTFEKPINSKKSRRKTPIPVKKRS